MRNLSKIKYLIVGLMLMLAWLQISNQIIFSHTHIIDGKYFVHAHPFDSSSDKTPIKHHNHYKCYLFFQNLSIASFIAAGIKIPELSPIQKIIFGYSQSKFNISLSLTDSNRAPPTL